MVNIDTRFRVRRRTAASWTSLNEVLLDSEIGLESDTTWPNSGGRKFKIGDGVTAWNSLAYAVPDVDSGGSSDPSLRVVDPVFDFMGPPPTATTAVTAGGTWVTARKDGTIQGVDGGATAPGVISLEQSATGSTTIQMGAAKNITLGGGEIIIPFRFRVPTLSDGTNTLLSHIGLADNFTGAANERIAIRFTHSENSGKLILIATKAGVATTANGTTALVANTWIAGRIEINAAGTQAELYVGSASTPEATITTGMPTGGMMLGVFFSKTAGATGRQLQLDYLGPPQITFTSPR